MEELHPVDDLALEPPPLHTGTEALVEALVAARRENDQLRQALHSRIVIEQAKGILAERHAVDVDAAFELLRRASRASQQRIHELAAEVVASPATPAPLLRERKRLRR
jgi:ANTAR domain